jgi:uncharacterized protein (DUF1697 family)
MPRPPADVARSAAFLRGINLGGRRVTGHELAAPFTAAGFEDVATFLASGNVVFSHDGRATGTTLAAAIEEAIQRDLGFSSTAFVRTADEVRALAGEQPIPPETVAASEGKLQVMLLGDHPDDAAMATVLELATAEDRLAFRGAHLYWLPSGWTSTSSLDLGLIERTIGPMTMRTQNTIDRLARKFF